VNVRLGAGLTLEPTREIYCRLEDQGKFIYLSRLSKHAAIGDLTKPCGRLASDPRCESGSQQGHDEGRLAPFSSRMRTDRRPRLLTNLEARIRRRLGPYRWRQWRTGQNRFTKLRRRGGFSHWAMAHVPTPGAATSPSQRVFRLSRSSTPLCVARLKPNSVEPSWYGPVCPVVWDGWHREESPYPDQTTLCTIQTIFQYTNRYLLPCFARSGWLCYTAHGVASLSFGLEV
jgi:hypothetical protein